MLESLVLQVVTRFKVFLGEWVADDTKDKVVKKPRGNGGAR